MGSESFSIDSYKIFNTVVESGSITKAAAILYISQPAVSKAVTKLEQSLSTVLFIRNSRGVKLTKEGRILYEYTSSAFAKLSEGENALRQYSQLGTGHIRLGTSTTLCRYLLLPYLKSFITLHPHIRFSIQCQPSTQTLQLLQEGKIDAALIGGPRRMPDGFTFIPLTEIEDIFAASPSYLNHLQYAGSRSASDFTDIISTGCLMLLDEENATRKYMDHYLDRLHIKAGSILEVSSMDLLIEFAKIGLGTACVIRSFITEELNSGQLTALSMPYSIKKRKAGFAAAANLPDSEYTAKFMNFCRL